MQPEGCSFFLLWDESCIRSTEDHIASEVSHVCTSQHLHAHEDTAESLTIIEPGMQERQFSTNKFAVQGTRSGCLSSVQLFHPAQGGTSHAADLVESLCCCLHARHGGAAGSVIPPEADRPILHASSQHSKASRWCLVLEGAGAPAGCAQRGPGN